MYISVFESRPDWKEIVEAVDCPMMVAQNGAIVARCDAQPGEPCRNVSAAHGTLWDAAPRVDYHRERKEAAIAAWRAAQKEVAEVSIPVSTAAGHSAFTPRGIAIPAPVQQQFIQSHLEVSHAIEEGKVEESGVGEHQGDEEVGSSDEASSRSKPEEGGQVEVEVTSNEVDRG
jgi:hypothetical protein